VKVYALITDAYGGHGGVAVYNRDLLQAFTEHPKVSEVVAVPRVISRPMEALPTKLTYRKQAARGVFAFLTTIVLDLPRIARSNLIYCGHLNLAPLAWILGKIFRLPVLGALYGIEAWRPSRRNFTARSSRALNHYYAISAYTRDRFVAWAAVPSERVTLLPNAIHLEDYAPGPKPGTLAERLGMHGRRVLLTFGRLVSRERAKGFDEVLEVLPRLVAEDPRIAYIIAGDGDYRATLEARVREMGLQDHVVFTGFVDEAEKAALYRLADIYVMPSRGEGFGFVFLEAMACGIPVVASSADGSRDAVLDGKLGAMVDPDDPEALLAAIREGLLQPRRVPLGLDYFSFPRFVDRTAAILNRMVPA